MNKRRIATMMILPLLVLAMMACESSITPMSGSIEMPQPLDAAAQATLDSGQREMMELSHQATVVSLNLDQAANAAARSTMEYNQRQLVELSIRGTEVSQNMARAAATATYSAYLLKGTQTAQAQAILDVQATQTAQVIATQTAYPLTATPWAALQAEIVRARNEADRRALWDEFVVTPLKVILITLVVLLLIVGGVIAYRRLMPVLELRLRTISRDDDSSFLLVDGVIVDPDPLQQQRLTPRELRLLKHPRLPGDETPLVEITDSSEPSVTNWIAEAEQKLRTDGWIQR